MLFFFGDGSVMVWGSISLEECTDLHVIVMVNTALKGLMTLVSIERCYVILFGKMYSQIMYISEIMNN